MSQKRISLPVEISVQGAVEMWSTEGSLEVSRPEKVQLHPRARMVGLVELLELFPSSVSFFPILSICLHPLSCHDFTLPLSFPVFTLTPTLPSFPGRHVSHAADLPTPPSFQENVSFCEPQLWKALSLWSPCEGLTSAAAPSCVTYHALCTQGHFLTHWAPLGFCNSYHSVIIGFILPFLLLLLEHHNTIGIFQVY